MTSRRPSHKRSRPLAVFMALTLLLPLSFTVMCVDVGGQPVLELAHWEGDHHHDEALHAEGVASPHEHQHEAGDSHGCQDQVVASAFAPSVSARTAAAAPPLWVRSAPAWPAVAPPHRTLGSLQLAYCRLPSVHHAVTSTVALI